MIPEEFVLNDEPSGRSGGPEMVFQSQAFIQAQAALLDGIRQQRGLMLLCAESGVGKSVLLRRLGAALGSTVNVILIESADLDRDDFIGIVCDNLRIATREQTPWDRVRDLRNVLAVRQQYGTITALLVDDAERLPDHALEGLIPLFQAENGRDLLVQIVLAGTEDLAIRVHQPEFGAVCRRVALEWRLGALTEDEVEAYIHARIRAAGHTGASLFTRNAIQHVAEHSHAIARRVDVICDAAVGATRENRDDVVTYETVCDVLTDPDLFTSALSDAVDEPRSIGPTEEGWSPTGADAPTIAPVESPATVDHPSNRELELDFEPWTASEPTTPEPMISPRTPATISRRVTPPELDPDVELERELDPWPRPQPEPVADSRARDHWSTWRTSGVGFARQVQSRIDLAWRRFVPAVAEWRSRWMTAARRGASAGLGLARTGWRRLESRLAATTSNQQTRDAPSVLPGQDGSVRSTSGHFFGQTRPYRKAMLGWGLAGTVVLVAALALMSDRPSEPHPALAGSPRTPLPVAPPEVEPRELVANVQDELVEAVAHAGAQRRALAEKVAVLESRQSALHAGLEETKAAVMARDEEVAGRFVRLDALVLRLDSLEAQVATAEVALTALVASPRHGRGNEDAAAAIPTSMPTALPGNGAAAATDTKGWTGYTVAKGDSLWTIARSHDVGVDELRDWNGLAGEVIRPGQRMAIWKGRHSSSDSLSEAMTSHVTRARASTYTVRAGDTLWGISEQFKLSVGELRRANGLSSDDRLLVGQRLRIGTLEPQGELNRALLSAASTGRTAAARGLLDQGADVNAGGDDGKSALMAAAAGGHAGVAEMLLAHDADPNLGDRVGETALMAAAALGDTDIVELLLRHGAEPNVRSADGWTALMHAAVHGHADTVRTLAGHGADVNAKVEGGRSALAAAAWNGHVAVVRVLLDSGAEIDATSDDGWTPLMDGALTGQVDVVRVLMENGANPQARANDGQTALTVARDRGHLAVAYMLASQQN